MGSTLMDGSVKTLFESTELGVYDGLVFVQNMQAGDTIELAVHIKNPENNQYYVHDSVSKTGSQPKPVHHWKAIVGKVGIKFTAQQTVGTYRSIDHAWFKR